MNGKFSMLLLLMAGAASGLAGCAATTPAVSASNPPAPLRYGILPSSGYSYDQNGNPIPDDYLAPGAPGSLYNPYR